MTFENDTKVMSELEKLHAQRKQCLAEANSLRTRAVELGEQILKLQRRTLQPGQRVRFVGQAVGKWAWLTGAVGTLCEIKRSKCVVEYLQARVRLPIADIAPIDIDGDVTAEDDAYEVDDDEAVDDMLRRWRCPGV